jgi:hypothetical protein
MSTLLAIKNLIDLNYPDNTTGLITPALERQVLKALADFVVSSQGEVSTSGFVYDAAFSYDAGDPVIYDSAWYLSLVGSNLNNQPDESPTEWEAINAYNQVLSIYETGAVYIGELILVIRDGFLYQLDRAVVGDTPFVSTDFAAELAANKWVIFTGGEQGPPGANGADGADGVDGKEVEFQVSATHIQWRYVGDSTWVDLIALSAITGADGAPGAPGADGANGTNGTNGADGADGEDGKEIELQTSGTWLQWRYVGDASWTNLFDFSGLVAASDPPIDNTYANAAAMIADQAGQVSGYLYYDGKFYYHYLGTTAGNITDYRRLFVPEYAAATHRENNTVLFDNDYVTGINGSARSGNILFDFTGAQLGACTVMRHQDASAFTFPAEADLMFATADISTTVANYFMFSIVKTDSPQIVHVFHAIEGGI